MVPGLVFFDCDGVLVDSERIALRANVEIGRSELGVERRPLLTAGPGSL